ncbi:Non-structural maintenance of chromosomes element 1 [Mactra antiquata]
MSLNPSQQMLLQSIFSTGILNGSDIFKLLKKCCQEYDVLMEDQKNVLLSYVRTINEAVAVYGLRIKKTIDEVDEKSYYCLVNTVESNFTLLSTIYTQNELDFFKKLVESIITSEKGNIGSIAAVNISDNMSKKMSKSDAEDLLDRFIDGKWIGKTKNGRVYLGCRSVIELEQYLLSMYEDNAIRCNLCKSLCTQGSSCNKCNIRIHHHCARKYFKTMTGQKCPDCKTVWNEPEDRSSQNGQHDMDVDTSSSQSSTSERKRTSSHM